LSHWLDQQLDAIFPIAHGTFGEDGCLQGFCELLDLPYVGPGVLASAVCMDKVACKQILGSRGIQVVDAEIVGLRDLADPAALIARVARLGWPCFVKPSTGGSSFGLVKARRQEELIGALESALRLSDRALVERAIVGRELECAVLGYRTISASGIGEIVPGKEFYDYADKYLEDGAQLIHRAELPTAVEAELKRLAIEAFEAVAGVGLARVDFFYGSDGELWLNEINTLPGFTAISMYPKLWEEAGVALPDLVDRLVRIACERHADQRRLDREIKAFIASLS
jgi:D-alanine-D-alanine ligase